MWSVCSWPRVSASLVMIFLLVREEANCYQHCALTLRTWQWTFFSVSMALLLYGKPLFRMQCLVSQEFDVGVVGVQACEG